MARLNDTRCTMDSEDLVQKCVKYFNNFKYSLHVELIVLGGTLFLFILFLERVCVGWERARGRGSFFKKDRLI